MNKTYLGDGVYAYEEAGMVVLSTDNGITETNKIYLEPSVLQSFLDWIKWASDRNEAEMNRK